QDAQFYDDLWKTIRAGKVWHGHFTNRRKDGTLYEEDATISPVRDAQGVISNFVGIKRDVTMERRLERQLRQAQKLESMGRLAAGVAHEINTPIQYVGDNTRFLKDALGDLAKLMQTLQRFLSADGHGRTPASFLEEIRRLAGKADLEMLLEEIPKALDESLEGIGRVATIVRSMKEFAHPSHEKAPFDINHAIQSTITVARNEWKYVADLETDLDSLMPPVPCVPGEFNQVILNMIVNAAHAIGEAAGQNSGRKGKITVRTRHAPPWAEILISDTGSGMSAETRSHIFDPFFTTKEMGKGTGQGLTLAHSVIVEGHGGRIDVETEPGLGTTFTIRLPLVDAASGAKETDRQIPAPDLPSHGTQNRA
ncbi:MAG: ATP-binding protein, partial [Acidobacteriota bacterium]